MALPLGFLEADQHEVIAHQQRTLDQQVLHLKSWSHAPSKLWSNANSASLILKMS